MGSNLSAESQRRVATARRTPLGSRRRIYRVTPRRVGEIGPAESAAARPAQGRWAGRVGEAGARGGCASAQGGRGGRVRRGPRRRRGRRCPTTGSNLSANPSGITSQNLQNDTQTCRRDWPGRKRRRPAGPGVLGGSGGGGGGEGWLRVSAGGRGGARQKGTSKASRSSVPRSQASARSAGPGLCQWARIMAPGGYSAMTTMGLSAGRWRTRLAALR
jgi:hypothetical protein